MTAGIKTDKLTKVYPGSKVAALFELNLEVKAGEVYGFLGANGAGKTTTIRLLMNYLQPTTGGATIMGLDAVKQSVEIKKHTGYLSGDVALYTKATGKELLDYLAKLQQKSDKDYHQKLVKRFEADLDKPIGSLSKGNRQKIGILQAFMHQPDVLILDEPTSGLDPLMQEAFYETLRECKQRGAAVLMSSHNLDEAQRVCDRVGIIKHGKLVREQDVNDLSTLSLPIFKVTFGGQESVDKVKSEHELKLISQIDSNTLSLQPAESIKKALAALSKYDIESLESQRVDLENEFLEFYGDAP